MDPINPETPSSPSPTPTPSPTASPAAPQAPTSPEPNPAPSPEPAPAATDVPWQDSLEGDLATNPLFRAYKTPSELAKAHAHLTALKGATAAELLKIPSKPQDQAPDDWAPIHKALGVPDDPKDYKIELAPEAAADTPELADILRDLGGKAKLTPQAMNTVVATLNELGQKSAEAEKAALIAQSQEVKATLAKEWGAATEGNTRAIGKLIRDALGGQVDEAAMTDLETSLGANLTLSRVLAFAVGKMAEPEAPEGGGRGGGGGQAMTPTAATAALNALNADPVKSAALLDRSHPQHSAILAERRQLLAWQRGEQRPDKPA